MGRQDLPKRRNEYHRELESLAKLATEISWDFEEASELIGRMPSRSKIKSVRRLVAIHGEVAARLDGAREALLESQAALQRKKESLEQLGGVTDVSELAAVLKVVPDLGDLAGRIHSAEKQVEEITDDIERKLRSMKPFLPANTDIEALALPPRNTVLAHRDEVRDWARNREKSKQQLIEASNYRQRDQEALERRVRNEGTVAPGALEEARSNRDTLWHLVKARYISCSEIPIKEAQAYAEDSEDLPASLEEAVKQADSIADQRFEKAQMAGELAVLADNVAAQETRIRQLEEEEEALKAEGEQLDKAWHAIWADVPIEVLAPDFMLAWLEAREAVVALIKRQRDVQRQLEESRRKEQDAIGQVRMALLKVGWDAGQLEANELRVMVERADTYRREQETKANRIIEMRDAMRSAKSKVARRQREVEKAEAKQNNWQADWAKAITAIDLKHDGEPQRFVRKNQRHRRYAGACGGGDGSSG